MFATAFVLRSSITTTIFFFAIFSLSNGVDNDYTVCSTRTSCRSLDSIEYPFWGGSRPKYCGLPDFVLKCDDKVNENPLIGTPWGTAYVRSINTSTHHITIAWKRTTYCWMIGTEFNVSAPLSFKLIPDDTENLTLFYGCDNSTLEYQNNGFFQCSDSEGDRRGAVLYLSELSEEIKEETKLSCKNFSVPVLKRELDKLNNGSETLLDILSKGVELEYVMNFTACSACQSSGGSCGSPDSLSSSEFVCYCPDGSHPLRCPDSGQGGSLA